MKNLVYLLGLIFYTTSFSQTPDPRVCGTLIYHDQLRKVLLLDGLIREPLIEQTKIWAWDGKEWKLLSSEGPLARAFGGIGYDHERNKVILFGGRCWPTDKMIIKSDTWEWDNHQWKQVSDTAVGLADRHHISVTYDDSRRMTLLAGGVRHSNDLQDWLWPKDVWGWDGRNWAQIESTDSSVSISSVAYDHNRGEVILFGESEEKGSTQAVTLIGNGKQWRKHTGNNPSPRGVYQMSYESDRGLILLYGGWTKGGNRSIGDMWQWDGKTWTEIKLTGNTPGNRGGHGMVYDSNRKVSVLFGGADEKGQLNDTWEWDGKQWTRK